MNETRDLLEQVGGRFPFPDEAFARFERRRGRKRRNQRLAAGAAGIAILIALLLGLRAAGPDPDRRPAPEPSPSISQLPTFTQQVLRLEGKPGIYLFDVRTGEATLVPERITDVALGDWENAHYQASPDGSELLFMGKGEAGSSQAYLASIDGRHLEQLTNEPYGAEAASFSPDGERIVYIALSGTYRSDLPADLVVMEIATGDTEVVVHAAGSEYPYGRNEIQYPHFSPDGRSILFTSGENGYNLYTVPVSGGDPTPLLKDGYDASYAPDGATIAFHRGVDVCLANCHGGITEPQIWLVDADGDNARPFGGVGTSAPIWSPDGIRLAFSRVIRDDETLGGDTLGSTGPGSDNQEGSVLVFDRETGSITAIAGVTAPLDWLDDRTLIVTGGGRT